MIDRMEQESLKKVFTVAKKHRIPISCSVELTEKCNFKCPHCFIKDVGYNELSIADYCRFIDQFKALGGVYVTLTGGEALTHSHFYECYVYACQKGLNVSVFSNGYLINKELISLFRNYPPGKIEISLYGASPEVYRLVTKEHDAFEVVTRNIVMRVFREHSEIPLKEKHISCFMVNWENKPSNIERIAEYLNIGLDSIVFVDDSSIEIESVKSLLPEVTAIQFDKYMDYEPFSCFNLRTDYDIEEVEKRTQTYQTNGLRNELKNNSADYTEYVKSLSVVADIHKAIPAEFSRIAELTQRTNKCTNGKRYTVEDIKERATLPNVSLYSVSVSDRFSDLGLVGAMEVENDRLTLFSLSCRALGREVEQIMIDYLAANHQIKSFDFISTNKNGKLQEVLKEIIKENTAQ